MDRQTIRELSARYKLEPELRDVFVEGNSDKRFFRWFLNRAGCTDAKVLAVDSVEIPPALLAALHLSDGNKQRVITLAVELNRLLGDDALQVTCIADADEDRLLRRIIVVPQLLWTDFVSLESYLFDEVHVTKFIHVVLGREEVTIQNLLAQYSSVLRELFLIRAAARRREIPLRWLPFAGCCAKAGEQIQLNVPELLGRLLDASQLRGREQELLTAIEELRQDLDADTRHYMNGYDFIELLHWEQRPPCQHS